MQRNGSISQINVIPFVDVMLVLLVIFMITAPMMSQGVKVDLPRTKTVHKLPRESDKLVLTVKKDRSLHLAEYQVKLQELEKYLKKVIKNRQQNFLYFRADQEVPYGFVVKVMSVVKSAGIQKLGVVAEEQKEEG